MIIENCQWYKKKWYLIVCDIKVNLMTLTLSFDIKYSSGIVYE